MMILHFKVLGSTRYVAIDIGLVSNGFSGLFGWMEQESIVQVKRTQFARGIGQFLPGEGGDREDVFSPEELETMGEVVKTLGSTATKEIIEVSDEEPAWIDHVGDRGLISYEYALSLKAFDRSGL
ncbi:MAG: hypothetical protein WBB45_09655 [Cyclobacteriaceae bacterium]